MTRVPRLLFRTVAFAEAITWTLLVAGLVLKYVTDTTDLGVTIAGPIHGFVFLAYAASALLVGLNQRWHLWIGIAAVAAAVVPFATVPLERALDRHSLLQGGWRRDRDPERDTAVDRMLRLVLAKPVISAVAAAALVIAAFATLLAVGPPRLS